MDEVVSEAATEVFHTPRLVDVAELKYSTTAKAEYSVQNPLQNSKIEEGQDTLLCTFNWSDDVTDLGSFLDAFKKQESDILVKIFNVQIILCILQHYCFATTNTLTDQHDSLVATIDLLCSNFHVLLEMEIPKNMNVLALGGYRSLLRNLNEVLENLLSVFSHYFSTTLTNTKITVSTKVLIFTLPTSLNKLDRIKQKIATQYAQTLLTPKQLSHLYSLFDAPYHLLLQINQGFPIILRSIPVSDSFPYQDMKVVTSQHSELMAYRHQLQIYQLGYHFNPDLAKFLHQLNIFFMSASDAVGYSARYRYIVFGASVAKYAVYPQKHLFLLANEVKKTIDLELLRVVWNVLEDPMMRWFAQKSGFLTEPQTAVNRIVALRVSAADDSVSNVGSVTQSFSGHNLNDMIQGRGSLESNNTSSNTDSSTHKDSDDDQNKSSTVAPLSPAITLSSSQQTKQSARQHLSDDSPQIFEDENTRGGDNEAKISDEHGYNKNRTITARFIWNPKTRNTNNSPTPTERKYSSFFSFSPSTTTPVPDEQPPPVASEDEKRHSTPPAVILHVHGGGFISQTTNSHTKYLNDWALQTGLPILSVDYRLAPEYPFPCAHYDCWRYYQFLLYHHEELLSIATDRLSEPIDVEFTLHDIQTYERNRNNNNKNTTNDSNLEKKVRIIVVGDSAGGNLVAGLALYALHSNVQPPEGLVLVYPATLLALDVSISRLLFALDPLLNHATTSICIESYVDPFVRRKAGKDKDEEEVEKERRNVLKNFILNPIFAPEELVKKFPPTWFFVGGLDPMLDDSWNFVQRLRKCGRQVKVKVYNQLPHGFLNLGPVLSLARPAVEDVGKALEELSML